MPVRLLDYLPVKIRMVVVSEAEQKMRIYSVHKEPETARWIDDFVQPGDVFYDIGANVGAYSLIAAARGAEVYAFEPEAMNFGRLVQNIEINEDLRDRIYALPMALWDRHELQIMWLENPQPGGSSFRISRQNGERPMQFSQALFTVRLDDLDTWAIPTPNHIKLDVDGYEWRVLDGGTLLLADKGMKSLMVEIDHTLPNAEDCFAAIHSAGLIEDESRQSIRPGGKLVNHIFVRPE